MRILALVFLLACGGPSRTTMARHPGSPLTFDRATANAEALGIADKTIAAHGGAAAWDGMKQVRWRQEILRDGKTAMSGEQVWDRWNARHWAKVDRGEENPVAVFYEIYGSRIGGYMIMKSGSHQGIPTGDAQAAAKLAKLAWQRDVTIMFAPYLLVEPGAKLEYSGTVKDEAKNAEYHDLKVTFDPKDPARAGLIVHVYADKTTFLVQRVEVEMSEGRFAYELGGYANVGGMQVATERKNVGSGEVIKLSDLKVGSPDDDLFIQPLG